MVEQLGSGIPRILSAYSKECFVFSQNFLRMSFPSVETVPMEDGSTSGAIGSAIGGAIELTPRQEEILNIIKEDNKISYRAIAVNLNINESATLKHINKLKEKGVLKRIGGIRGRWEVMQ